jgi:hypothetical protein
MRFFGCLSRERCKQVLISEDVEITMGFLSDKHVVLTAGMQPGRPRSGEGLRRFDCMSQQVLVRATWSKN